MSATDARTDSTGEVSVERLDMKLEAIVIPVSDVDRAKAFYAGLGWRLDADLGGGDFRIVQFNPPGSGCSVQFGNGLTSAEPGSALSLLVVSDIEAAQAELEEAGIEGAGVFHDSSGGYDRFTPGLRASGPDPERRTYASFASFADPDGNVWQLQEITNRLPGRIDPGATTYSSVADVAAALRRAAAAHGEHEARIGKADPDWPDWYAAYMVAEQSGAELPT
jgi:catechol 2,3-dioxygenase-like lactoylglutathione lyase family enzyme